MRDGLERSHSDASSENPGGFAAPGELVSRARLDGSAGMSLRQIAERALDELERRNDGAFQDVVSLIADRVYGGEERVDPGRFGETVAEHSTIFIYVFDLERRSTVYTNRNAGAFLGYTSDEIAALGGAFLPAVVHPDELEKMFAHVAGHRTLGDGQVVESEWRFRKADGEWRYLWLREAVFKRDADGHVVQIMGTAQDVTERKRATEALAANERLFREFVRHTPAAVAMLDTEMRYLQTSDRWITDYNLAGQEIVGRSHYDVFPDIPDHWKEIHSRVLRGEIAACDEDPFHRANGDTEWLQWAARPWFKATGEVGGLIFFTQVITERKAMEEELRQARDAALESARLKAEFLANMSHEIRTPMNGIIGMAHMLLDSDLDEEQRDFAETIRTCSESLLGLLNDILDFSKIDAGKLDFSSVDFSPREVADGALSLLAPQAREKGLGFAATVSSDVPQVLRGDPQRLRQVLVNLVGNAVKFTDSGEVTLSIRLLEASSSQVTLRFEVRDTGIGISDEVRERLFQAFSQGDGSTTRRFGGTGLGLAISKRLVHMMSGAIDVESVLGVGSCFSFSASFDTAKDAEPRGERAPARATPLPLTSAQRVLVAEDNTVNQKVIRGQLEKLGCSVDVVANGRDAVAAAMSAQYDIVLMDCQMPIMDGYAAATSLKEARRAGDRGVPIIAMTASAMIGERERCIEAGMDDYVTKPVDANGLRAVIEKWTSVERSSTDSGGGANLGVGVGDVAGASLKIDELIDEFGSSFASDIIDEFSRSVGENCDVARSALSAGDSNGLGRTGHAIKGSSLTIGAEPLSRLGALLERIAPEGDRDRITTVLAQIEEELGRVRETAAAALSGAVQ